MAAPELSLLRQTSLHEEKVTKNGSTYNVHVVVKNSPFQVALSLKSPKGDSFTQCTYDIRLVYDESADNKEVAFVKVKPVEYKPTINESGDQISFDVKIKVLSSHHEDNFFRLKIEVWDPANETFPKLCVLSAPIKVISKPLKHRKKAAPGGSAAASNGMGAGGQHNGAYGQDGGSGGMKRSNIDRSNDDDYLVGKMDALLEEQQQTREELRQLRQLMAIQMGVGENGIMQDVDGFSTNPPPAKRIKTESGSDDNPDKDFEGLLSRLIQVYSTLEVEEKTEKTRRMLRTMSGREAEMLVEMFDLLNAAGLQGEAQKAMYGLSQPMLMNLPSMTPSPLPPMGGLQYQAPNPNSSAEMSRQLDQFYNEVFF